MVYLYCGSLANVGRDRAHVADMARVGRGSLEYSSSTP